MIVLYWVWRAFERLIQHTPQRFSMGIMESMGEWIYRISPQRQRIARENFSHVLNKPANDPSVHRVAAQAFRIFARELWCLMATADWSMRQVERQITLHGEENLTNALALGKGLIVTMAHFGNFDLPTAVVATRFKPVTSIGEDVRPPALMNYLKQMRAARNVFLYSYEQAPRKMLEALKRNEIVGLMLDFGVTHQFDMPTVEVGFFGAPTKFSVGPAQLALLTGAPIIVAYTYLYPNGTIDGYIGEALAVQRSGNRQQDFQTIMQELAHRFEDFIRLHPVQWHMFRPMWSDHFAPASE